MIAPTQLISEVSEMMKNLSDNQFQALITRFKDQTEELYRLTLLDLRIFSGYLTLQLVMGAWLATKGIEIVDSRVKCGLLIIDFILLVIVAIIFGKNFYRRKEVVETVRNCNVALGFEESGIYLKGKALNAKSKHRPWIGLYIIGVIVAFIGEALFIFVV